MQQQLGQICLLMTVSTKQVSQLVCALAEGSSSRQLATMDFLREVAKIGGIRHEVSAIYKRWILGSGCPKIFAAYFYNR